MLRASVLSSLILLSVVGCSESGGGPFAEMCAQAGTDSAEPRGIHAFASDAELDGYLGSIAERNRAISDACSKIQDDDDDDEMSSAGSDNAKASNENITNNQEAGVDEGGIVKNVGGSLVVLRQGRLYVVDVAGAAPVLTDSMRAARTEPLNSGVWYDEMLVKGDLVYVIGYRYQIGAVGGTDARGATEIDSFRIANGKLTRLRSMFLESNDYYSGRNYASRMVGGRLVFYMPHAVARGNDGKIAYPRVLEADDAGAFRAVGPIFGALDVVTSLVRPSYAAFHTVVQCDLPESGELACHGRSVLGTYWRESYVSNDAVYLWASSHVYRFDFDSLDVVAHKTAGSPLDQFSFRQSSDGATLLVASNQDSGPSLVTLPIAAFDKQGGQANVPSIPIAGGDGSYLRRNRFVGDVLLAVTDVYASKQNLRSSFLVKVDPQTKAATPLPLPQDSTVVRIEPLGADRAMIATARSEGSASIQTPSGLTLRTVSLDDLGKPLGEVYLEGVSEGEGRSHGFFFKPAAAGKGGAFGYAVINPPTSGARSGWGNGISNIGFFDVAESGAVSSLGIVSAGDVATACETSCTDWYGNTRPIFLGDRVFALMGSELAAVSLRPAVTKNAAAELTVGQTR